MLQKKFNLRVKSFNNALGDKIYIKIDMQYISIKYLLVISLVDQSDLNVQCQRTKTLSSLYWSLWLLRSKMCCIDLLTPFTSTGNTAYTVHLHAFPLHLLNCCYVLMQRNQHLTFFFFFFLVKFNCDDYTLFLCLSPLIASLFGVLFWVYYCHWISFPL